MKPCSRRLPVLPEELILEILYRVPLKSLLRFRCVGKSWKTLISSPQFVKDYCRISFSSITTVTHQRLACMTSREITTCCLQSLFQNPIAPPETSSFRVDCKSGFIFGSCNGLLCWSDCYHLFKLINPFTRLKSKRSPPLGQQIMLLERKGMYGFGYDQVNNKYKVIISYDGITQVHTFGTKSWKTIQTFPPCASPFHWLDRLGKFESSSGTLNWLVGERDRIISFDLEKETYGQVLLPLPHHMDMDGDLPCTLEVLSNRLCLCYVNDIRCVMWSMNTYGIQESWTKLILIPRSKIPSRLDISLRIRPLCISENGLVLMELGDSTLFMYNALNGKFEYPKITSKGSIGAYMHIYHESSVSPLKRLRHL